MAEPQNPGNFPKHVVILRTHSECLRATLADQIESVARNLNARFVIKNYQSKDILEKAKTQPEDGVSDLIDIIKGSQKHFDDFIQCLNDMKYTGLVEKLTGTVIAAVGTTEKGRFELVLRQFCAMMIRQLEVL
ncbi:hypothetical protein SNE40_020695 [Patella caerulea]|uniref:Uncharacterized protein n=1 Tax=Patella caerulea TaxID=87958 RepID=A0AAN8J4V5_PATCE